MAAVDADAAMVLAMSTVSPGMSTTLLSLSNEILGIIIDLLNHKKTQWDLKDSPNYSNDISNLRLTCKILADLGARNLFKEVSIITTPTSIENLLKIAQQERLRVHVKAIMYDSVEFSRPSFEVWENHLTLPPEVAKSLRVSPYTELVYNFASNIQLGQKIPPFPSLPFDIQPEAVTQARLWLQKYGTKNFYPKEQRVEAYLMHQTLLTEIEAYELKGKYVRRLQDSIGLFPNLKKFTHSIAGIREDGQISNPSIWHLLTLGNLEVPFEVRRNFEAECQSRLSTLQVIKNEKVNLETLKLYQIDWSIFEEYNQPSKLLIPTFMNLKHLELTFMSDGDGDGSGFNLTPLSSSKEAMLGTVLSQATRLEILSLKIVENWDAFDHRHDLKFPCWEKLAKEVTWPRLKKLYLWAVDMTQDHAIDFMSRHSPTLEVLHLSDIFLQQGTWKPTFCGFKKALKLKEARFKGIFGVYGSPNFNDRGEYEFDAKFHLPMELYHSRFAIYGLGQRETLDCILAKFFSEGGHDDDPLKYWGHGVLPEGVEIR